jgi:hypothetical protein
VKARQTARKTRRKNMKLNFCNKAKVMAAVGAVALTGMLVAGLGMTAKAGSPGEDESFRGGKVIVGTWRIKVQLVNCDTRVSLGHSFTSLLTFNDGGTFTGSTSNPVFAPGQRGPEQGVWEQDGKRTYEAKSGAFILFTTPPNPPHNPGFEAGLQTIAQKIEFDENPDEFTSDAKIEFFDATGTSYRKGCASATATRFE